MRVMKNCIKELMNGCYQCMKTETAVFNLLLTKLLLLSDWLLNC